MLVHSLFVLVCFLLDNGLSIAFPTNYLLFGTIFVPSLGLCAIVLCSRDMDRLDAILFSFLAGMVYDFFFAGTFLMYAIIFAVLAFLVSFWKNHLFNSVVECFIICAAALFFKDLIAFLVADQFMGLNMGFSTWITRYEAGNIFCNLIASIFVIALYFVERKIIKSHNKKIRSGERIHWYEASGGRE